MKINKPLRLLGEIKSDLRQSYGENFVSKTGIENIFRTKKNAISLAIEIGKKQPKHIRESVELLIYVTQSPSHNLPSDVYRIQAALGIKNTTSCIQICQGCSGFAQALLIANSFFASYDIKNALVITSDTYTQKVKSDERAVSAIFSDGATSTFIEADGEFKIVQFDEFSDGGGAESLVELPESSDRPGLYMDGGAVFHFTQKTVSASLNSILDKQGMKPSDVDLFLLHQASLIVLKSLAAHLKLDFKKMPVNLKNQGNITSSTIPSLIKDNWSIFCSASTVVISGFGVGLSAITLLMKKGE